MRAASSLAAVVLVAHAATARHSDGPDLRTDSLEQVNPINVPAFRDTARVMRARLFDRLEATGGMQVLIRRGDWQAAERKSP